ncbi:GyrI-like domain-containing protein [Halobacillus sp. B23F22_1]|uniref:GyrI-like domain-containing protein n=1 Tax=Halobacillus sp. B23F22_1 TaxID=3459514 RepID=UPI00373EB471
MTMHKPAIKEIGAVKLIGFRVWCEDGGQYIHEIPKAAAELDKRRNEICHLLSPVCQIGAFKIQTNSIEEDGYWVGFPVREIENVPRDMTSLTIPSQTYASLHVEGSNDNIRPAYEQLQAWMQTHDYPRLLHKWHLEKYTTWGNKQNVAVELLDTTERRDPAKNDEYSKKI